MQGQNVRLLIFPACTGFYVRTRWLLTLRTYRPLSWVMFDQWRFIEAVAKEAGVSEEALRKWRIRGVPTSRRLAIVDAARDAGFDLDRGVFDNPPGPKTRQPEPAEAA
jgi:hypothetical protein